MATGDPSPERLRRYGDGDAANSFITLSARTLRPELFIVTRARSRDSSEKLMRAGADRVVNPQSLGGSRMAAFVLRPHVAEFVDVVAFVAP